MYNPNPIPAVGSRWLKSRTHGRPPVEVEVLRNDERNANDDLMIRYRELRSQYERRLQFFTWRMPSYVVPAVPAPAAPATSAAARTLPLPLVDAPRVDTAPAEPAAVHTSQIGPPCKMCGKPSQPRRDRSGTHGRRWRSTCSDECMYAFAGASRLAEARARRSAQLTERDNAAGATQSLSTPPPTPPASQLRRGERGERLTVYLPPDLARALRVRCAEDNRSASDAVTTALLAWLTSPT